MISSETIFSSAGKQGTVNTSTLAPVQALLRGLIFPTANNGVQLTLLLTRIHAPHMMTQPCPPSCLEVGWVGQEKETVLKLH